jgi:hypothetical protein
VDLSTEDLVRYLECIKFLFLNKITNSIWY